MLLKLFWSLLALLASLVGFWGAVNLGWTYELLAAAALVATSLVLALVTGQRRTQVVIESIEEESGADKTQFVSVPSIPIVPEDVVCPGIAESTPATCNEEEQEDEDMTVLELPAVTFDSDVELLDEIRPSNTRRFEWGEVASVIRSADAGPSTF